MKTAFRIFVAFICLGLLAGARVQAGIAIHGSAAAYTETGGDWITADESALIARVNNGDGTATWLFRYPTLPTPSQRRYGRIKIELR